MSNQRRSLPYRVEIWRDGALLTSKDFATRRAAERFFESKKPDLIHDFWTGQHSYYMCIKKWRKEILEGWSA